MDESNTEDQGQTICCLRPQLSIDWRFGIHPVDETICIELSAITCRECGAHFKYKPDIIHFRVDGQAILISVEKQTGTVM